MRPDFPAFSAPSLLILGLAALAGGCASGSSDSISTASIHPRPEQGMVHAPAPAYAQTGSNYRNTDQYQWQPRPSYLQTGSLGPQSAPPPRDNYNRWSNAQNPTGPIQPVPPIENPQPMRWHAGNLPPNSRLIVVHEGDTLYGLSRRHGVSVAELVSVNRLESARLDIGQRLLVPADGR